MNGTLKDSLLQRRTEFTGFICDMRVSFLLFVIFFSGMKFSFCVFVDLVFFECQF